MGKVWVFLTRSANFTGKKINIDSNRQPLVSRTRVFTTIPILFDLPKILSHISASRPFLSLLIPMSQDSCSVE